jgi:hypothetical protein
MTLPIQRQIKYFQMFVLAPADDGFERRRLDRFIVVFASVSNEPADDGFERRRLDRGRTVILTQFRSDVLNF